MKLYKVTDGSPGCRWHASKTGLHVKRGDSEHGDTIEVNLPKEGRQGMADFLNANENEIVKALNKPDPDFLEAAELAALRNLSDDQIDTSDIPETKDWSGAERGRFAAPVQRSITLTDVEEFIQNAAAAPDLASIASNVCWRIKELGGS